MSHNNTATDYTETYEAYNLVSKVLFHILPKTGSMWAAQKGCWTWEGYI